MNQLKLVIFSLAVCLLFQSPLFSRDVISRLNEYLIQHGHTQLEGHCCAGGTTQPDFLRHITRSGRHVRSVAEIGFNAGHSSLIFLDTRPQISVMSFDLMSHRYAACAKEFVDRQFPRRHTIVEGNSLQTVPRFAKEHPEVTFDLIFLDGGHSYETALHDILNMKQLSHKETILIVDDLGIATVKRAWEQCVRQGVITRGATYRSKHKAWCVCKYIFR